MPSNVVVHQAWIVWVDMPQASVGKCVDNCCDVAQQRLQEPELRSNVLQAILNPNDSCHSVQPADDSLHQQGALELSGQ